MYRSVAQWWRIKSFSHGHQMYMKIWSASIKPVKRLGFRGLGLGARS